MRPPRNCTSSAFTLLELVVVLAILSVVTALAFRSIDQVQDQTRYEANNRIMRDIERAVVGSLDDRAIDGSPTISGFVADMGRLPKTRLVDGELTLEELWLRERLPATLPKYDVRRSEASNTVPGSDADNDVYIASGWRGPYFTLPIEATNILDGWGNLVRALPTVSPASPLAQGYHRLRTDVDAPITTPETEVRIVRHLGANGRVDAPSPDLPLLDEDKALTFLDEHFQATVKTTVEVLDTLGQSEPVLATERVIVRVFGPSDVDQNKIKASPSLAVEGDGMMNPLPVPKYPDAISGSTIGARVVRAYLYATDNTSVPPIAKSSIKHVTLRPGVNSIPLTIFR